MPRASHGNRYLLGSWQYSVNEALFNSDDCFPRILLFYPLVGGLVAGFAYSTSTNLTAAPGILPAFASIGFLIGFTSLAYCFAGLPVFRRSGCRAGCGEIMRRIFICTQAVSEKHSAMIEFSTQNPADTIELELVVVPVP